MEKEFISIFVHKSEISFVCEAIEDRARELCKSIYASAIAQSRTKKMPDLPTTSSELVKVPARRGRPPKKVKTELELGDAA